MECTGPKASPLTMVMSKNFGDPDLYPPCTRSHTLTIICQACNKFSPLDFKVFLKVTKTLFLNGVMHPFWMDWPLSCPLHFLHVETLHHLNCFSWDHDIQWCIEVITLSEIDFCFSLLQTAIGYYAFENSISKLKQVTGHDHHSIQWHIIGIITGAIPH